MRTHDQGSEDDGAQVGYKVFQRMRIYCNNANRGSPFMMDLVNVTVNTRMMEQPGKIFKDH